MRRILHLDCEMRLALLLTGFLIVTGFQPETDSAHLLADAEAAAVDNFEIVGHIEDNYGDPSEFQKYFIRRPPVLV